MGPSRSRPSLRHQDPAHGPAEQVVAFARLTTADLIAIGIPEGRSLADVIRGTIAERIVQNSACPVLVVNAAAVRAARPVRIVEPAAGASVVSR